MMIWNLLIVVAVIALIISFSSGKNSVWGGLTLGIIIGVIWAIVASVIGKDFHAVIILRLAVIGALVGFGFDLLAKLSEK